MSEASNQSTVIGADTTIKGEISFDKTAQILGTIEGKITSKGEVLLGSGATCNASVDGTKVTIEGNVDGDVTGKEQVKLAKTAVMSGDLIAQKLVVEEGAVFVGHCQVGGDAGKIAAAKANGVAEAKPAGAAQKAEPAGAKR